MPDTFPSTKMLPAVSDAALLAAFRTQRDEASFHAIVLRHGKLVNAAIRHLVRRSSDIDDISQATFLTLLQHPESIQRSQSLGSWLYGVAQRLALQHERAAGRRKRREQRHRPAPLDDATRTLALAELQQAIAEAVQQLPERYRQAIIYCYLEARSPEEAAKLLGCPIGTLWSRLARGRDKLRTVLSQRGWNVELPAIALSLSALAATGEAATHLWPLLQQAVQWNPLPTVQPALSSAVANLLFQEKVLFSVRSLLQTLMVAIVVLGVLGTCWTVFSQAQFEQPRDASLTFEQIEPASAPPKWKCKLQGKVTAADTGKPLAGATISINLHGLKEPYHIVSAISGDDGRYSMAVPAGHLALSTIFSPPGYYLKQPNTMRQFAMVAGAVEVCDFVLTPGTAWKLHCDGEALQNHELPWFSASRMCQLVRPYHQTAI